MVGKDLLERDTFFYAVDSRDVLDVPRVIFPLFVKITFDTEGLFEIDGVQIELFFEVVEVSVCYLGDERVVLAH